ncbi:histone-lysine N-methyltransferase set9-like [Miscanthus floridulus]|uniref:histone-lysine N-methyltransferase set9-like n=1 Tax=Miscanthus floridulus TaxID=154761 RepID=UPI00345A256B
MALPSSSAEFASISPLGFLPVTEKMTRNNHAMWKAQVISALKGAQMVNFIDPAVHPLEQFLPPKDDKMEDEPPVVNPEFEKLVAKDQQVLNYLLTSLSREIGSQVTAVTTASTAWSAIEVLHAS